MWNERQIIEIFHLLFLRAFGARIDKALFVLKGGCNLRFFLKSIRYSEDMDLDIHTMTVGTLRNNIRRLLDAPSFVQTLRAQGIEIARTSLPKQTNTTQRWKLALRITESGAEVPRCRQRSNSRDAAWTARISWNQWMRRSSGRTAFIR
jgi:predicted nucleotidyltransferase component of viral defense system